MCVLLCFSEQQSNLVSTVPKCFKVFYIFLQTRLQKEKFALNCFFFFFLLLAKDFKMT